MPLPELKNPTQLLLHTYGVEGLKATNRVVEESSSFATTASHLIFGSNEKQNLMGKGSVSLCSAIAAAESDKVRGSLFFKWIGCVVYVWEGPLPVYNHFNCGTEKHGVFLSI